MESIKKPVKKKSCNYVDIYGNKFTISAAKNNNIRFTLYHSQIDEGLARKDYEYMTIQIDRTTPIFPQIEELYSRVGNAVSVSTDPIRDGRNCIIIEGSMDNERYFLTFCRDLANELNLPGETNVVLAAQPFVDFFDEITTIPEEKAKQYQMKLTA